jgi:hypothetical protein
LSQEEGTSLEALGAIYNALIPEQPPKGSVLKLQLAVAKQSNVVLRPDHFVEYL